MPNYNPDEATVSIDDIFAGLDKAFEDSIPFELPDERPHLGLVDCPPEVLAGRKGPYIKFTVYFPEFNKRRTVSFNMSQSSIPFVMRTMRILVSGIKRPSEIPAALSGLTGKEVWVQMKANGDYNNYQFVAKPEPEESVLDEGAPF